jgi:hypothetical protein
MKSHDLTCFGVHRDPPPRLVALLRHEVRHVVRFDLKALHHHVLVRGDGLNMQIIRPRLNAVDQNASEPCEPNADSATDAAPGNPLHQQAFHQGSGVIGDERWLNAFDKRASTGLALMMLFTVMHVTIVRILG